MNKKEINKQFELWEEENISLGIQQFDRQTMKRICKTFAYHLIKMKGGKIQQ